MAVMADLVLAGQVGHGQSGQGEQDLPASEDKGRDAEFCTGGLQRARPPSQPGLWPGLISVTALQWLLFTCVPV